MQDKECVVSIEKLLSRVHGLIVFKLLILMS